MYYIVISEWRVHMEMEMRIRRLTQGPGHAVNYSNTTNGCRPSLTAASAILVILLSLHLLNIHQIINIHHVLNIHNIRQILSDH